MQTAKKSETTPAIPNATFVTPKTKDEKRNNETIILRIQEREMNPKKKNPKLSQLLGVVHELDWWPRGMCHDGL